MEETDRTSEKIMDTVLDLLKDHYNYIIIDCGLKHELLLSMHSLRRTVLLQAFNRYLQNMEDLNGGGSEFLHDIEDIISINEPNSGLNLEICAQAEAFAEG